MSDTTTTAASTGPAATSGGLDWTDLDRRAVDTGRGLAMDAVQRAGNGHPGTAMSLAPVAYMLYQRLMTHDPSSPRWPGRDRFVLSCGHTSLTQYIQLYLSGYGLELEDLKALRTWGSRTPGHPEMDHTPGIEITTGPLGQGFASAVGMAFAARRERGLLDPDAAAGESVFDHTIWVLASDGDIEEGVTSEASSLAGHQELGNLVVVYDANHISIEDDTAVALSEDTGRRYEAYGWHVQTVDWTGGRGTVAGKDGTYGEDLDALYAALRGARAETSRPSLVILRTVIAWPAPNLMNTGKAHGSALGEAEVAATKRVLGLDPERAFQVDDEVLAHARQVADRGRAARRAWEPRFERWKADNPERAAIWARLSERRLPDGWQDSVPRFEAGQDVATRKASGVVLNAVKDVLPELWGGSADLAESNNTALEGEASFLPQEYTTPMWGQGSPYGRILHFGIREHAMGSIMNGIALHGGLRVFGGTFLVFSDYMRPAVRLAALMGLPVTYVWTHDSIGLGEDGPTHQPVEHLAALRAIPGLDVVRPGGRQRDGVGVADDPRRTPTGRPGSACPGRTCPPSTAPPRVASAPPRACEGRLRPQARLHRGVRRQPAGRPGRHRLGGADRGRGRARCSRPTACRPAWCPCRAGSGSTRRTQAYRDEVLPPSVRGPGQRRGRHRPGLARGRRRRRPDRVLGALRRLGGLPAAVPGVRVHHRARRRRSPGEPDRRRRLTGLRLSPIAALPHDSSTRGGTP